MAVQTVDETARVSEYALKQVNGEAMQRLALKRETAQQAAKLSGVAPFAVFNFNPVDISVMLLGDKVTIPAATSRLGVKRNVMYQGESRIASVMVMRELKGFARPISAQNFQGGDPQSPQMDYEWIIVPPVEQVRAFEFSYNESVEGVGGVIVCQGDADVLHEQGDAIRVPAVQRVPRSGMLIYTAREISLAEKLMQVLDKQKAYCLRRIATGKSWWEDDDKRSSVHDGPQGFLAWGEFAVKMGWQHREELPWLVGSEAMPACGKCGKRKTSGTAFFCQCGHPYDPLGAYMAGYKVDTDLLATLPDDKLKQVKNEMQRRKRLFADDEPTGGKAKGKPSAEPEF